MTKKDLKKYIQIERELNDLEERIQRLKSELESPKRPIISDIPKGKGYKDTTTDKVAKLIELKELYNTKWVELIDKRLEIEKAIDKLEPTERLLMRLKYIDGLTWEQVCVRINYSWRQTHRIHGAILKKMT